MRHFEEQPKFEIRPSSEQESFESAAEQYPKTIEEALTVLQPKLELDATLINKLKKITIETKSISPVELLRLEENEQKLTEEHIRVLRSSGKPDEINHRLKSIEEEIIRLDDAKESYTLGKKIVITSNGDRKRDLCLLGAELGHVVLAEIMLPWYISKFKYVHPGVDESYDIAFEAALTEAATGKRIISLNGHRMENADFGRMYTESLSLNRHKSGSDIIRDIARQDISRQNKEIIKNGVWDSIRCPQKGIPAHCIGFYIVEELKEHLGENYAKAMVDALYSKKTDVSNPNRFIDSVIRLHNDKQKAESEKDDN